MKRGPWFEDWIPEFEDLRGPSLGPPDLSFAEYIEFLEENGFWREAKPLPKPFPEKFWLPDE